MDKELNWASLHRGRLLGGLTVGAGGLTLALIALYDWSDLALLVGGGVLAVGGPIVGGLPQIRRLPRRRRRQPIATETTRAAKQRRQQ